MQTINNEVFYHIQNIGTDNDSNPWEKGKTYTIGGEITNNYYNGFSKSYPYKKLNEQEVRMNSYVQMVISHLISQGERDCNGWLSQITSDFSNTLGHYQKLTREIIYEQVRSQSFSDLPSRKTCLWVLPYDTSSDIITKWKEQLYHDKQVRLLTLQLTGKIHITSEIFLINDCASIEEVQNEAADYWKATDINSYDPETIEVLFEGQATVLDISSL